MYALVSAERYGGKVRLLAIARTMWMLRRKWRKLIDANQVAYRCVGILTPNGLVNYHGDPMEFHGMLALRMMLDDDEQHDPAILAKPPGG